MIDGGQEGKYYIWNKPDKSIIQWNSWLAIVSLYPWRWLGWLLTNFSCTVMKSKLVICFGKCFLLLVGSIRSVSITTFYANICLRRQKLKNLDHKMKKLIHDLISEYKSCTHIVYKSFEGVLVRKSGLHVQENSFLELVYFTM